MIGLLIKFFIPVLVGYFFFKKVSSAIAVVKQMKSGGVGAKSVGSEQKAEVIDICPDCGHQIMNKRHRC